MLLFRPRDLLLQLCTAVLALVAAQASSAAAPGRLEVALRIDVGQKLGQLRAAPLSLGAERGLVVAYAADFDIDPFHEMFFYPTDTLKIAVYTLRGELRWKKDLGRGTPPGIWFCPVFPFDLDGDGVDEIWHVRNSDDVHPFAISKYRLDRLDARTGKVLGSWPWPRPTVQPISHMFRNFILGGMVKQQPVLVTAQGTYTVMKLQAWKPDMSLRWEHAIAADAPGARGSHMCPVVDFDGDGVEEILWGERLIELDTGKERFCADRERYKGHSDVIQPFLDARTGQWRIFTCRENDHAASPRVLTYDHNGNRIWGALEVGHIDMGWVAHLENPHDFRAMAIRIGHKALGPAGRTRTGVEEFMFDAVTGAPVEPGFPVYQTIPVDLDGDGIHELVYGSPGGNGDVIAARGRVLGNVQGTVQIAAHFLDAPGEHVLAFAGDGTVRVWRDPSARDSEIARRRYAHPFYRANLRLTGVGYNLVNLSGL